MPGRTVRHRTAKTFSLRIAQHKRRPAMFARAIQRKVLVDSWQRIVDTVGVDTGTLRANNNPWRGTPDLTKLPYEKHDYPSRDKVEAVAESLRAYERAGISNPQDYGIYNELRTGAYQMAAVRAQAMAKRHASVAELEQETGLG